MEIEPITKDQLAALHRLMGPQGFMVDLQRVDITVGRGIGRNKEHYLWTREGYRITVWQGRHNMMVKRSKDPDPEYFKMKGTV